jgi:hypothetical protein
MVERQELHCHACQSYVQFDLDLSMNGNHVLNCPKCGHEHCRVVKDGKITDDRWDQRNGGVDTSTGIVISGATYTTTSTYTVVSTASTFTYSAWMNTTATGSTGTW